MPTDRARGGARRTRKASLSAMAVVAILLAAPATASAAPGYTIRAGTGTLDPGTTIVPGSSCDDCVQPIALPFPVTVYGQSFTTASADSNGALEFGPTVGTVFSVGCPLPQAGYVGPTLLPYHGDLSQVTAPSGIYTSTTGSTPNRTFNIEWRAQHFHSPAPPVGNANFEIQFHENSSTISFVYGAIDETANESIGVQQGGTTGLTTQFSCKATPAPPTPVTSGLKLDLVPLRTLTVAKAGLGSGGVTSADPGINCGATCSATFADGTSEVLTATPDGGSGFVDWSGCDIPSGATCTMALGSDKSVTANFDVPPQAFTASASGLTLVGATVAGTVNGGSGPTTFNFDYGTDPNLAGATNTPATSAPTPNDVDQPVSQSLTGLAPGTRYYYRVDAANSAGSASGAIFSFKTPAPAGAVITKHPDPLIKTSKRRVGVKFAFSATNAGGFQCKLDDASYTSCVSPTTYRVRHGKHKFKVVALTDGLPGTPATFKFKVVAK